MPTFMIVRSRKKLFHESNNTDGENLGLRNSLYVMEWLCAPSEVRRGNSDFLSALEEAPYLGFTETFSGATPLS